VVDGDLNVIVSQMRTSARAISKLLRYHAPVLRQAVGAAADEIVGAVDVEVPSSVVQLCSS
jgi:hypothetical protein